MEAGSGPQLVVSGRRGTGWFVSKIRRYPAVAVCALAATMGITLGNLLVPSLDQALGISDIAIPAPVSADSNGTSPHSTHTDGTDATDPSEPTGDGAAHPDDGEPSGPGTASRPSDSGAPGSGTSGSGGVDHGGGPSGSDGPSGSGNGPDAGTDVDGAHHSPSRPSAGATSSPDGGPPADGDDDEPGISTAPSPDTPSTTPTLGDPSMPIPTGTPTNTQTPGVTPTPEPTETPDEPSFCLEVDLSPLEVALCLLGGTGSTATPSTTEKPTPGTGPSQGTGPRQQNSDSPGTATPGADDERRTPDGSATPAETTSGALVTAFS